MNEAGIQKKTAWTAPGPNEPLFIAESPEMQEIKTLAARASGGDAKVLVTGESGVGKDVVACFIHARSNRSQRPFVAVNCAAFSETLLESELFGHVRGSFTGAHRDKIGKLQQAHKGTVFLDEVGEMSLPMQALLLRFLESGEIQPVGADGGGTKVDVRVISATNRDLPALIASGQFREDLMYRIRLTNFFVTALSGPNGLDGVGGGEQVETSWGLHHQPLKEILVETVGILKCIQHGETGFDTEEHRRVAVGMMQIDEQRAAGP